MAANIASILAPDGSYFLNIKEHADDGERNLYVKDLVIAHRRQWGWRFVDEFCWRKTDNGVPGGWGNRFKNAWEPVLPLLPPAGDQVPAEAGGPRVGGLLRLLARQPEVHVRERAAGHRPARRGSRRRQEPARLAASAQQPVDSDGRFAGVARPSNVIEVKSESSQGTHSAPFPRALVEFFLLAFSDEGDVVFDPFMG